MIYLDTSFLVPLFLVQPSSRAVRKIVSALPAAALSLSDWTKLEFASALAQEVRAGSIKTDDAERAQARFEAALKTFRVILPEQADFDLAQDFVRNRRTGLRSGDALHLAIAANHDATIIYSLDKAFLKAGAILGLPVRSA